MRWWSDGSNHKTSAFISEPWCLEANHKPKTGLNSSSFVTWIHQKSRDPLNTSRTGTFHSTAAATASTERSSTSAVSPPASEFCGAPSRLARLSSEPPSSAVQSPVPGHGSLTDPRSDQTSEEDRDTSRDHRDRSRCLCRNIRSLQEEKTLVWRNELWRQNRLQTSQNGIIIWMKGTGHAACRVVLTVGGMPAYGVQIHAAVMEHELVHGAIRPALQQRHQIVTVQDSEEVTHANASECVIIHASVLCCCTCREADLLQPASLQWDKHPSDSWALRSLYQLTDVRASGIFQELECLPPSLP